MARKLKRKEVDELEKIYGERKADPGMLTILRENYMRPLTSDLGQSLINYRSYGSLFSGPSLGLQTSLEFMVILNG